jgi:hypothetical protein
MSDDETVYTFTKSELAAIIDKAVHLTAEHYETQIADIERRLAELRAEADAIFAPFRDGQTPAVDERLH